MKKRVVVQGLDFKGIGWRDTEANQNGPEYVELALIERKPITKESVRHRSQGAAMAILFAIVVFVLVTLATRSKASDWENGIDRIPPANIQGVTNTRFQWTPGYLDYARGAADIIRRAVISVREKLRKPIQTKPQIKAVFETRTRQPDGGSWPKP